MGRLTTPSLLSLLFFCFRFLTVIETIILNCFYGSKRSLDSSFDNEKTLKSKCVTLNCEHKFKSSDTDDNRISFNSLFQSKHCHLLSSLLLVISCYLHLSSPTFVLELSMFFFIKVSCYFMSLMSGNDRQGWGRYDALVVFHVQTPQTGRSKKRLFRLSIVQYTFDLFYTVPYNFGGCTPSVLHLKSLDPPLATPGGVNETATMTADEHGTATTLSTIHGSILHSDFCDLQIKTNVFCGHVTI